MKKFAHADVFLHKSAKHDEENALLTLLSQSLMQSRHSGEKDSKSKNRAPEMFKNDEKSGQNASQRNDFDVSRGDFASDKRKLLSALEENDGNDENGVFEQNFSEDRAKNSKNPQFSQSKNVKNGENCGFSQNFKTENRDFIENPQNKHSSGAKEGDLSDTRQEKYDGLDAYCALPPYYIRH